MKGMDLSVLMPEVAASLNNVGFAAIPSLLLLCMTAIETVSGYVLVHCHGH